MAGYSGTPLPQKLGIKPGSRLLLVAAPADFPQTLGEMPADVTLAGESGDADVIVCFTTEAAEVEQRFLELKPRLAYTGGLWFAWPKKQPGKPAILSENVIRDIGLAIGLVDNKVCAIDERWSGLRFVWRLEDRPKVSRKAVMAG